MSRVGAGLGASHPRFGRTPFFPGRTSPKARFARVCFPAHPHPYTSHKGCRTPGTSDAADPRRASPPGDPRARTEEAGPIATPQSKPSYRLVDDRTDEQLLSAYRTGDVPAFRTLIERYHDELMRFLIRFMGDRQAAEDVFQETFLQIHQSADSFDESRRLKPWLFTIAANKGRDSHRRTARRPVLGLSAHVGDEDGQTFVDLMAIDVPPPNAALDRQERERQVQDALDSLPDHQREILLLAYFQKLSYQQVAEQLSIPIGTVKSRLHAAVAGFARKWAETAGGSRHQR